MAVITREATMGDYVDLCEIMAEVDGLHREALPHLYCTPDGPARDRNYVQGLVDDPAVGLFVAEINGRVAGVIHVHLREAPSIPVLVPRRYASIADVAVRSDCRRHGVGTALMERAHDWARARGAASVELTVFEFNGAVLALYERLGYETLSRRMSKPLE